MKNEDEKKLRFFPKYLILHHESFDFFFHSKWSFQQGITFLYSLFLSGAILKNSRTGWQFFGNNPTIPSFYNQNHPNVCQTLNSMNQNWNWSHIDSLVLQLWCLRSMLRYCFPSHHSGRLAQSFDNSCTPWCPLKYVR